MKYAIEMGSGAMIYIPSFIKIGSGIPKLIGRIYTAVYSGRSLQALERNILHSSSVSKSKPICCCFLAQLILHS
jgi:hypothetical protein